MEGQWHVIKWIQAKGFIIDLHVIPNSLLVAQMEVVFLMVCRDHVMASMVLLLLLFFILVTFLSNFGIVTSGLLPTRRDACIGLLER